MDNDPQTTSGPQEPPDQERQDRRQFFNGLGKWSLAIVAAVSSLAGSGTRAQASRGDAPKPEPEPRGPAWALPDDPNPRGKMARGKYSKKTIHNDYVKAQHSDSVIHYDSGAIQ